TDIANITRKEPKTGHKNGKKEFQQPKFESYRPKSCKIESKNASENIPNKLKESTKFKESSDVPLVKKLVSDDKLEKKTVVPTDAKILFVKAKQQEKPVRKPVKYAEMYREMVVSRNNYTRVNYNNSTRKTYPNAHRNMAPRAILIKTGLRPLNTARLVNTAHPKTTVNTARPRPVNIARLVNTTRPRLVNTVRPRPVNTARPNSSVVNAVKANQFWQSATTRTLDNGELEITAIIDGKVKVVTEASIRRYLKFEDSEGVDVRHGGAATTVTSLDAGQGNGNIDKTPSMPHDLPLLRVNTLGSDDGNKTIKTGKARRKAKIVDPDDEEEFKDPCKQGRNPLGVLSVAKVLANAAKVHTYTRRRKTVNTGSDGISTVSRIVSSAKESVSTASASMPVSTAGIIDKEEELEHEGSKKQKTSEASRSTQEQPGEEEKELSQDDLQQLMIIVPEQGVNVEALQTKYPIIDWEIYTEDARKY
nr:hypothetical protein [Tanacetum cinerariifolium]